MRYIILGASAAGVNAARELRNLDSNGEIIIAAKEDFLYSRCILHHIIEDKRNKDQLYFAGKDVIEKHNIDFRTGHKAQALDENKKEVTFENGETISYDKLLIATGSSSFIPPIKGIKEAKQVVGLRDYEDAEYIREQIKDLKRVAIIGSGLVGMDIFEGLVYNDCEVHLIDLADHLLSLQLDDKSAGVYMQAFEEYNVHGHFGTLAQEVITDENGNVQKLILQNGEELDVDLIVVSAGTRANIGFLEGTSLEIGKRGLVFDKHGKTNVEDIFGAGDVSGIHPIWPMAVKEGIIAAHNMVGEELELDDMFSSKSTMNFLGIPTMSLGEHTPKENIEDYEIFIDEDSDVYKKVVVKDGYVVGAILQGDLDYSGILTQLIKRKINISSFNKSVFRINYADFFSLDERIEYRFNQ